LQNNETIANIRSMTIECAPVGCYRPHPPSPFIAITQLENANKTLAWC